jgi:hypothetical protein
MEEEEEEEEEECLSPIKGTDHSESATRIAFIMSKLCRMLNSRDILRPYLVFVSLSSRPLGRSKVVPTVVT